MISQTIIERTANLIKSNPSMDIMEATKQAIQEEQSFIVEMIEQKTERSVKALKTMRENVYAIIHLKKALS